MYLLVTLIERFEAERYSLSVAYLVEVLRELMEARGSSPDSRR
jgi:hypothetical protein